MKKLFLKISLIITLVFTVNSTAFGITVDELLPRPGEIGEKSAPETVEKYPETGAVAALPEITTEGAITSAIKTILEWSMLITIAAIVVSAIYYITAQGEEEVISKAKGIIKYLVIGVTIMAAAYGIIAGISQFQFF